MLEKCFCKWEFHFHEKLKLFSKLTVPVTLYGAELWGGSDRSKIVKFQCEFIKRHLKLRASTPNFMVTMESGCKPIEVEAICRLVTYWAKLADANFPNPLAKQIYTTCICYAQRIWVGCMMLGVVLLQMAMVSYGYQT